MAADSRFKLHVVYCGRGDAMYVEYPTGNVQSLMIVDGGPATRGFGGSAPYWKYFLSAGKQIWRQMQGREDQVLQPAMIVATHAHEDHVGGILRLIQAWREDKDNERIRFSGSVYLPAIVQADKNRDVASFCNPLAERHQSKPDFRALNLPDTGIDDPFTIEYPPQPEVAMFTVDQDIQGPSMDVYGGFTTITGGQFDNLNHKSILLTTNFVDGLQSQEQALFTGDSSGWTIRENLPKITNGIQNGVRPHFSVYKIQHHGSGIDCQATQPNGPVSTVLVKETAILAFLEYEQANSITEDYRERFFVERELHERLKVEGVRLMQEMATKLFLLAIEQARELRQDQEAQAGKPDSTSIRDWLRERHNWQREVHFGLVVPNLQSPATPITDVMVNQVWGALYDYAHKLRTKDYWAKEDKNEEARKYFFIHKDVLQASTTQETDDENGLPHTSENDDAPYQAGNGDLVWRDWFVQWITDKKTTVTQTMWWKYWQTYCSCRSIRDFFMSFTADAYVVSANYAQHGHPTPTTVFGLAWALYEMDRTAELFLTSSYSLYVAELKRLTTAVAQFYNENPDTLFERFFQHRNDQGVNAALVIRYMDASIYMTIDIRPGEHPGRGLKYFNTIDFWLFDSVQTLERHRKLESQTKWVLEEKPLGEVWQHFGWDLDNKYILTVSGAPNTRGVPEVVRLSDLKYRLEVYALCVKETWEDPDLQRLPFGSVFLRTVFDTWCIVQLGSPKFFGLDKIKFPSKTRALCSWEGKIHCVNAREEIGWATADEILAHGPDEVRPLPFQIHTAEDPNIMLQKLQHQGQLITHLNTLQEDALEIVPTMRIMSTALTPLSVSSVIMAEIQQPLPISNTNAFAATAKLLSQFLSDSAVPMGSEMTTRDVLAALINEQNLDRLGYRLKYQQAILKYPVDVEKSLVAYSDSLLGTELSSAMLVLGPLKDAKINIDAEDQPVTNAEVWLNWSVDSQLTCVLFLRTENNEILRVPKSTAAFRDAPPTLAKVLIGMGFKNQLEGMTLASALAAIFRDAQKAQYFLSYSLPSVFLKAGLDNLIPDLYASTARAQIGVTGRTNLQRVEIVLKPAGVGKGWNPTFSLDPVEARVKDVRIVMTNVGSNSETITINAVAELAIGDFKVVGGIVARLPTTGKEAAEIQLTLSGNTPLADACNLLPKKPDFSAMDVPLSKGPKALTMSETESAATQGQTDITRQPKIEEDSVKPPLQKLGNLKTEQVGITLRQLSRNIHHYVVQDIFLAANLEGWKDYLPVEFPKKLLGPEIRVMVLEPLSDLRAIAVHIKTALTLTLSNRSETMDVKFSASPLVLPGDYEYQVHIAARNKGLSVFDILRQIGMTIDQADLLSNVPVLGQVLSLVYLKTISVAVISTKESWEFGDWELQLGVPKLNLVASGKIQLQNVDLAILKSFGELSAVLTGTVYFASASAGVQVTVQTPKKAVPGSLRIDCSRALGLEEVWNALELPDVSHIPVVRELFGIRLETAYFTIANTKVDEQQCFKVTAAHCAFTYEDLDLGFLKIDSLWVSVGYEAAQKPDAPAKHNFSLSATIAEDTLRANFSYSSSGTKITSELQSLKSISIASTVDLLLSESFRQYNILHDILGDLGLDHATLHMSLTDGYPITYFNLEVSQKHGQDRTNALSIGNSVSLEKLVIEYRNSLDDDEGTGQGDTIKSPPLTKSEQTKPSRTVQANEDKELEHDTASKPREEQSKMSDEIEKSTPVAGSSTGLPAKKPRLPIKPEAGTTLDIKGEISADQATAEVTISCISRDGEKTATISIVPKGLRVIRSVLNLLGFGGDAEQLKKGIPLGPPDCFDVDIKHVDGEVAVVDGKLQFRSFEFVAQSIWSFTVFEGPPEIKVLELKLEVRYNVRGSGKDPEGLRGSLFAIFSVSEDVRFVVAYHNEPGIGNAFVGSTLGTRDTQIIDLAKAIGMDSNAFQLPKTQNESAVAQDWHVKEIRVVFLPKKYIEITGTVTAQLTNGIGGVDLKLEELKALLRIDSRLSKEIASSGDGRPRSKVRSLPTKDQKSQPEGVKRTSYEVWLKGRLKIKGLVAAEAWLYIKTGENSVLTALLKKDEVSATTRGLEQLADQVSASNEQRDVDSWDKIVPKGFQPLMVGETGVSLYANFTQPKLILAAQIGNKATALLLVKTEEKAETKSPGEENVKKTSVETDLDNKTPDGQRNDAGKDNISPDIAKNNTTDTGKRKTKNLYMVSLVIKDLASLWEPLKEAVSDQFPVVDIAAHIQGYDSTIKKIKDDLVMPLDADEQQATTSTGVLAVLDGLKDEVSIKSGAWFFASIDLSAKKAGNMKDIITLDISEAARTTSSITLYARLKQDETIYQIAAKDFSLFGDRLKFNGIGTYQPNAKGDTPYFDIDAQLTVLLKSGSGDHLLQFNVRLSLYARKTTFNLEGAQKEQSVSNPLPDMFNITLSSLGISGTSIKDENGSVKRNCKITGKARLGSNNATMENRSGDLDATLIFLDGVPRVAVLEYSKTNKISMASIFDDIVAPNPPPGEAAPVSWPKDECDALEFESAVFSYAKADEGKDKIKFEDVEYLDGLSLAANLKIFEASFSISAVFPRNRSGVKLTGTYNDDQGINLYFARIVKSSIDIDTTRRASGSAANRVAFTAVMDLVLFDEPGFQLELLYQPAKNPKDRNFEGTASYKPLKEPDENSLISKFGRSLTFTYKNGRWSFKGWNLGISDDELDFLHAIEQASHSDSDCAALVDLVADQLKKVVKTKFNLILGLPKEPDANKPKDEFWFTMTWSYKLTVVGKVNVVSIEGSEDKPMLVKAPLKGPFTLKRLVEIVWETIKLPDNWKALGQALLRDADKLAKLIAMLAVEEFGKETVKGILCRKAKPDNIKNRGRNLHKKQTDDLWDKIKKFKEAIETLVKIGTVAGAIGAVIAIGGALASIGPEIGLLLAPRTLGAVLLAAIDDEDEKKEMKQTVEDLKKEIADLAARQLEFERQIADGLMLTGPPTAEFLPDIEESTIRVNWGSHPPMPWGKPLDMAVFGGQQAVLKWDVRAGIPQSGLKEAEWLQIGDVVDGPDQCKLQWEEFRYASRVTVWVRAQLETQGRVFRAQEWVVVHAEHHPWLRPPTGLSLTVQEGGGNCVVGLPPAEGDVPGDYAVELVAFDSIVRDAVGPTAGDAGPGQAHSQANEAVMFRRPFSGMDAGAQEVVIPITSLPSDAANSLVGRFLRARACQLAWDSTLHNSPTAVSVQWLPLLSAPPSYTARMDGRNILAEWEEPAELSPDRSNYTITVRRLWDGNIATTASDASVAPGQKHSVRMPLTSSKGVRYGDKVTVIVQASATPTAIRLAGIVSLTVLYPPVLSISAADYDLGRSLLSMYIVSDQTFAADSSTLSFRVTLIPVAKPLHLPNDSIEPTAQVSPVILRIVQARTVWENMALIRMELPGLQTPAKLHVGIGEEGDKSDPFPLLVSPPSLTLGTAHLEVAAEEQGAWRVVWLGASPADAEMTVHLEDSSDRRLIAPSQTVPVGVGGVTFLAPSLAAGTSMEVFRMIRSGTATGPRIRELVEVPSRIVTVPEASTLPKVLEA